MENDEKQQENAKPMIELAGQGMVGMFILAMILQEMTSDPIVRWAERTIPQARMVVREVPYTVGGRVNNILLLLPQKK
jgi:hypothetical protein